MANKLNYLIYHSSLTEFINFKTNDKIKNIIHDYQELEEKNSLNVNYQRILSSGREFRDSKNIKIQDKESLTGKIYSLPGKYGFIETENKGKFFFPFSKLSNPNYKPSVGDEVSFNVEKITQGEHKFRAIDIKKLFLDN